MSINTVHIVDHSSSADTVLFKNKLQYVRISQAAYAPMRNSYGSVGYDLRSPRDYILRPQKQTCVPIDLQLRFPEGSYGRIASLSIILSQFKIGVIEGVIDRDFMGNVCVCLINYSKKKYTIKRGDRIAQLICEKYTSPQTIEMLSFTAKTSHIERSSVVLDTPPPTTDVLQSTKM